MLFSAALETSAHQQPTTLGELEVKPNDVILRLEIPIGELSLAFGNDIQQHPDRLIEEERSSFTQYLKEHIDPISPDGKSWNVEIGEMTLKRADQEQSGPYEEVVVITKLIPPPGASTRTFNINYDVILHKVVTHKAIFSISKDWDGGVTGEKSVETGSVFVDTADLSIAPLKIDLDSGSYWKGFRSMLSLGMEHIREGTDHLLFLLVLLLPAPLIAKSGKWTKFAGVNISIKNLLKIITSFTLGHSLTLILGASGLVHLPSRPIEVLIAVSILVTAIHAIRPLFPGKEMLIAMGFGLIHGLAFAGVLSDLDLTPGRMALSILGFNLGIEIMQLIVMALIIPWLLLLSQTNVYKYLRVIGAISAGIASVIWIAERIFDTETELSKQIVIIADHWYLAIIILAILTFITMYLRNGVIRNEEV